MKTAKTIVKAEQATAVDFGTFDKLNEYVLELGPEVKIPGKVFGGTLTGATGGEFSFQSFAPGAETGFLHTHKIMRNSISSSKDRASFRWTAKCFPFQKAVWCAWRLLASVPLETMEMNRW